MAIYRRTGKVWTIEDFQRANEERREEARNKIRRAVSYCVNEGLQISRATLATLTSCSPNTLKKHADLWKLLAIGSGEYNSGGAESRLVFPSPLGVEEDFSIGSFDVAQVQKNGNAKTPPEAIGNLKVGAQVFSIFPQFDSDSTQWANGTLPTMAGELRTEQSESGRASRQSLPRFDLQNLWTRDNIQTINKRTEIQSQSAPQFLQFNSSPESIGIIASGADGFALFDKPQLIATAHSGNLTAARNHTLFECR